MLSRILAILSAICLVGAFALATVLPPLETLAEALDAMNHPVLLWLRATIEGRLSPWLWANVAVPLLLRPDWLLLAGLGLVFAGAAATLGGRKGKGVTRSHRRRS